MVDFSRLNQAVLTAFADSRTVTVTRKGVSVEFSAIFRSPQDTLPERITRGYHGVEVQSPSLKAVSTDLDVSVVRQGAETTVGSTSYEVIDVIPDDSGMTTISLREK